MCAANTIVKGTGTTLLEQLNEIQGEEEAGRGNVFLTVDINIQRELEAQLKNIQTRWGASKVGGIVMDPHNGAIVAMGSVPTFNPNTFNRVTDYSVFNNPNVEDCLLYTSPSPRD